MRVISKAAIVAFSRRHPEALPSLTNWCGIVRRANWRSFAELRRDFGSADIVDRRTVFNIKGNAFRLIARVNYRTQRVFVLGILTHAAYDKGEWRS